MQRELLIIRHAKAEEIQSGQQDFDRDLKKRGVRDAESMGGLLASRQLIPDLLCASPAKRTTKTAEILAKTLQYSLDSITFEQDIYEADLATLLKIVHQLPDHANRVFLVGHNPGFSSLADYLSEVPITFLPTCGMAFLRFEAESWSMLSKGGGQLVWFEVPKENH